jgi:hypothetical protein
MIPFIENQDLRALTNYFNENMGSIILYGSLYFFITLIVGVLNYAYVPIYLKLYDRHKGANFGSQELFDELKANIEKIIIFIFASILVMIPTMVFVIIVMFILSITLIGIPFILCVGALVSMFFHATLMEYINTDKGVFDCFGYGYNMCFQKFFPVIGAITLFLLMSIVFQSGVGFLQIIIQALLGITVLTDPNTYNAFAEFGSVAFMVIVAFQLFSYLINLLISAVIQLNQGIIFYGLKEEKENIHGNSTIDEIGSGL